MSGHGNARTQPKAEGRPPVTVGQHGDRGAGSAYLLRRGEVQIYGCAVCEGGMAIDTIALVRRVEPGLSFAQALERCHVIDPVHCPDRSERAASTESQSRAGPPRRPIRPTRRLTIPTSPEER